MSLNSLKSSINAALAEGFERFTTINYQRQAKKKQHPGQCLDQQTFDRLFSLFSTTFRSASALQEKIKQIPENDLFRRDVQLRCDVLVASLHTQRHKLFKLRPSPDQPVPKSDESSEVQAANPASAADEPKSVVLLRNAVKHLQGQKEKEALTAIRQLDKEFPEIAKLIFGKVWELAGKPTTKSQPRVAHPQFGRVAFFGEQNRNVSIKIKQAAVQSVLDALVKAQPIPAAKKSAANKDPLPRSSSPEASNQESGNRIRHDEEDTEEDSLPRSYVLEPSSRALPPPPARPKKPLSAAERENRIRYDEVDIERRLKKHLLAPQLQMAKENHEQAVAIQADNRRKIKPFKYLEDNNGALEKYANDKELETPKELHVEELRVGDYRVGVCHFEGAREGMEDEHLAVPFNLTIGKKHYPGGALFPVFDGHGGRLGATFLKKRLEKKLESLLLEFNPEGLTTVGIWNALKLIYVRLNKDYEELIENHRQQNKEDAALALLGCGSTAAAALLLDGVIWTFNVADSRIVLDSDVRIMLESDQGPLQLIQFTEDQKPEDPQYEKTINHRGGEVTPSAIVGTRVNSNLAVARAFGDLYEKGISARTKVNRLPMKKFAGKGARLGLGCDGIFDVATTGQIYKASRANRSVKLGQFARNIVYSCFEAYSKDNLTYMAVDIPKKQAKKEGRRTLPSLAPEQRKNRVPHKEDHRILPSLSPQQREDRVRHDAADIERRLKNNLLTPLAQMEKETDKSFVYINDRDNNLQRYALDREVNFYGRRVGKYDVGICDSQGMGKPKMEDKLLAVPFALTIGKKHYPDGALFAIFDGYDGPEAANFLKDNLQKKLELVLQEFNSKTLTTTGIWNALKLVYVRLKKDFEKTGSKAGSTATAILFLNGDLWTFNIGRSRIIVDRDGESIQLTEDQRPQDPTYEKTIRNRGGEVIDGRVNRLSTARAFGEPLEKGVSARPKINRVPLKTLTSKGARIGLGSDGIFNVASTRQINKASRENRAVPLSQFAASIVYSSHRAGSKDDCTYIVIDIPKTEEQTKNKKKPITRRQ